MDFIAIDFETANSNLNSACSIGIVVVQNLQIIEEKYFLIKPPTDYFNNININIHGITYDDVKDSLTFSELWSTIKSYFDNTIVIAHNAHFDMSVLKNCLDYYDIDIPDFTYLDSKYISSISCDSKTIDGTLVSRAEALGISIDNHHNALDDAIAAAKIVIETVKYCTASSFTRFCLLYLCERSKEFKQIKEQKTFGKVYTPFTSRVKISEVVAVTTEFDSDHLFFNKNLVLTGELTSLERKEAMQKIVDIGGVLKSGVSRVTDYLIVGIQDKRIVGDDGMSSKEEKAYSLIEQGFPIKIINESEFIEILFS